MSTNMSGSAVKLIDSIRKYTPNVQDVLDRLDNMLDDHVVISGKHVEFAMRNIGKVVGEEVPVGEPTQPLKDLGYPTGG